jgi:hypothetical protein
MWPPDALWPRIAAVWRHAHGTPGGEQANAAAALKQYQLDFDLSDTQIAYIAEYDALDPGSRIVRRERAENAFEVTLGTLGNLKLVMPFEHFVVDTAWILHTYVFTQFLHTPRLLIWSRGSGFGKTARLSAISESANHSMYMIAPSGPALYRWLGKHPTDTLVLDNAEHSRLWNKNDVLRQVYEAGHRKGGTVLRCVLPNDVILFPTNSPLALGTIVDRKRRDNFPSQILNRSIACEMKKSAEGEDEIFPGDPRFVPVRAVNARWAEGFQAPSDLKMVRLPRGIVARGANNWRVLAAIADALGYGATLRAAAVTVDAENFDPELRFYEDLHGVFGQRPQESGLWVIDIMQALAEIEDGPWGSLTRDMLYDLLYRRGIEARNVWKVLTDGKRRSNKGIYRKQLEPVWCELGYETQQAQSSKIIRLPRHNLGT